MSGLFRLVRLFCMVPIYAIWNILWQERMPVFLEDIILFLTRGPWRLKTQPMFVFVFGRDNLLFGIPPYGPLPPAVNDWSLKAFVAHVKMKMERVHERPLPGATTGNSAGDIRPRPGHQRAPERKAGP